LNGRVILLAAIAVTIAVSSSSPVLAFDARLVQRGGLSQEQAEEILWLVLRHEHLALPSDGTYVERLGASARASADLPPSYFSFGVSRDDPRSKATSISGRFAISRSTGDVWELNLCRRYSFAALRRIQQAVMKRTGKTFVDERAARRDLGCPGPA
jgi:hypothetical protein